MISQSERVIRRELRSPSILQATKPLIFLANELVQIESSDSKNAAFLKSLTRADAFNLAAAVNDQLIYYSAKR